MKKKKNNGIFYVVISLVAVLGIGSIALGYAMNQNVNVDGDYNYYEAESSAPVVEGDVSLGASPGPDRYAYQFCDNDVCDVPMSQQFAIGTTTACAIQSPFASSTLMFASIKFDKGTTTAMLVDVGQGGANYTSTSTVLFKGTVGAGDTAAIIGTSTPLEVSNALFDDKEYLVFNVGNSTGVGVGGECKAIFRVLNN